ncbi:TetR/AcrR family transcriptional regulator [Sanguibacter inulinus]|uniref:TetR family transcriptional regulator n=1 Tax=Sanguibacter inulinus TaxID=60922 RepID=A0A853EWJ8_9MICO|nr:TetR family transcriptional regulator [Sanguibacter inulinus]MBF0722558.1 TetR family transcriptional regulator [Sanguibacter inulinus]NYS93703.1 TetR family transcriptional regulator [Sanguibacter inulinus]
MTTPLRRQPRGAARRDAIVEAAAALVVEAGPSTLTHRTIAQRADVPLAATTYYFASLDDLVGAAGTRLAERWAVHADAVLAAVTAEVTADLTAEVTADLTAEVTAGATAGVAEVLGRPGSVTAVLSLERRCAVLVDAVLPAGGPLAVRGHYEHLVSAGRDDTLAGAYAAGRAGLDEAVTQIVDLLDIPVGPEIVVAVVDGAAVSALSEGGDVRVHAELLLRRTLLALQPAAAGA